MTVLLVLRGISAQLRVSLLLRLVTGATMDSSVLRGQIARANVPPTTATVLSPLPSSYTVLSGNKECMLMATGTVWIAKQATSAPLASKRSVRPDTTVRLEVWLLRPVLLGHSTQTPNKRYRVPALPAPRALRVLMLASPPP